MLNVKDLWDHRLATYTARAKMLEDRKIVLMENITQTKRPASAYAQRRI